MQVTIKIGTMPVQNEAAIKEIIATVQHPKALKKKESIEDWYEEKRDEAGLVEVAKTSFNGGLGRISHIAFKLEGQHADCIFTTDTGLEGEARILKVFDEVMYNEIVKKTYLQPFFIGHYIAGFDLKFLYHRYVVHGIRPRFDIPWQDATYKNTYYDTMSGWAGHRDTISLDALCKYLSIPRDGLDSAALLELIQAGRYVDVANYFKRDVEAAHQVFKKLTFV